MLYIDNTHTNPYFNLATEEYLLKNFNDSIFMLWRDEPCIVVGKNQNTYAEVNIDAVKKNNIPVVRRLSGGGAVFHDLGNLNFTFIENDSGSFNDFRKFTQPIIDVLKNLSVNAEFSGRNDLTIDGKKFSGNAQYNYRNRILHHGTLLFSSNITDLSSYLKVNPLKFKDKSVKSVRSRVTNISSHLEEPISILDFKKMIFDYLRTSNNHDNSFYEFTDQDINNIQKLVDEKYSTWDWNFGTSPNYNFTNEEKFACGHVQFNLNVEKGIIKDIKIFGDFFSKKDISELENILVNVKHSEIELKKALSNVDLSDFFHGVDVDKIVACLF